jgi:hypothetical protein
VKTHESKLSPEIQKLIQEQVRKHKYNPDEDPVMINFRKKMDEIRKEDYRYNEPSNMGVLIMIGFVLFMLIGLLRG